MEDYIANVVERTEAIHNSAVAPYEDNMLKVTSDSKKASIDLRLIDESYGLTSDNKLKSVISEQIYRIYDEYRDQKATQLVFCDSSTPKSQFNVYDEIKNNLIKLGVNDEEIAFIHDYKTTLKEKLYRDVNKGEVRVLIGSTAKLGAGTNVQKE